MRQPKHIHIHWEHLAKPQQRSQNSRVCVCLCSLRYDTSSTLFVVMIFACVLRPVWAAVSMSMTLAGLHTHILHKLIHTHTHTIYIPVPVRSSAHIYSLAHSDLLCSHRCVCVCSWTLRCVAFLCVVGVANVTSGFICTTNISYAHTSSILTHVHGPQKCRRRDHAQQLVTITRERTTKTMMTATTATTTTPNSCDSYYVSRAISVSLYDRAASPSNQLARNSCMTARAPSRANKHTK